jgi:hypothetical protein
MSFPLNEPYTPTIFIKDIREGSQVFQFDANGNITQIDHFINTYLVAGTATEYLTYGTTQLITQSDSYWNGSKYQTEEFVYGTSNNIISTNVTIY